MIAQWKSWVVVSIVLAAIAWLGRHNDSGSVDHRSKFRQSRPVVARPAGAWSMSATPIRRGICRSFRTTLTSEHPQNVPPCPRALARFDRSR
jgi:hypothetical protein